MCRPRARRSQNRPHAERTVQSMAHHSNRTMMGSSKRLWVNGFHDAPVFCDDMDRSADHMATRRSLGCHGLGRRRAGHPIRISGVKVDFITYVGQRRNGDPRKRGMVGPGPTEGHQFIAEHARSPVYIIAALLYGYLSASIRPTTKLIEGPSCLKTSKVGVCGMVLSR